MLEMVVVVVVVVMDSWWWSWWSWWWWWWLWWGIVVVDVHVVSVGVGGDIVAGDIRGRGNGFNPPPPHSQKYLSPSAWLPRAGTGNSEHAG